MRRAGSAIVLALALVGSLNHPAVAVDRADPDDVSSTLDISRVESGRADEFVVFTIRFYEVVDWRKSSLWLYLDSRSGPGPDYLAICYAGRGKAPRCALQPWGDSLHTTPPDIKRIWPQRVTIGFRLPSLHPTHAVRWKVRTLAPAPGPAIREIDHAPDSFGDWYHVS